MMLEDPKNILIVQLRQLGDILLTTPVASVLRDHFQDAKIYFLCHKMGLKVLDQHPDLDGIFTYEDSFTTKDHLALIKTLRAQRFDAVFDFMNNPRSAFLSMASGAKKRISFASSRSLFYHFAFAKTYDQTPYIVTQKLDLLEALGIPVNPEQPKHRFPYMHIDKTHYQPLFQLAKQASFHNATWRIVLSPTHRRAIRQWSKERFVELAHALAKDGATVLWLYGPGEKEEVVALQQACKEETLLLPEANLKELGAMFRCCDLFIGNSNGPSHVAVAASLCSLQLHGHTDARSWCPNTTSHRYIQSKTFGAKHATLDDISFADVYSEWKNFLPHIQKRRQKVRERYLAMIQEVSYGE